MWSFLDGIFGTSGTMVLNAVFALGIVLVMILLALWALKFVFRTSNRVARGRNRRLTIVDNLPVDQRRQLLIVRRDHVEHLVLIGGGQDVVIETGIPVEPIAARQQRRAMANATAARPPQGPVRRNSPAEPPAETGDDGRGALERLRNFGHPQPQQRRAGSLRHTGLMRGEGRVEPAVIHDNSDGSEQDYHDSGRNGSVNGRPAQAGGEPNGQAPSDDDEFIGPYRDNGRGNQNR